MIEMAREAGFESNGPIVVVRHSNGSWIGITKEIERLISIVRADEREACAKVCEAKHSDGRGHDAWGWMSKDYADAIRAR
jgi:hypothetical protein